jgi:phosphorylcholine metabolism protein LicD
MSKTQRAWDLQQHGHDLLREVLQICDQVGIRAFLMFGTLLGCIREGQFIGSDYDIDLGLLEPDLPKIPALKQEMLLRQYRLRLEFTFTGRLYEISFLAPHCELWVDLCVLYESDSGFACADYWSNTGEVFMYSYPLSSFEEFKVVNFLGGLLVPVPLQAESILRVTYGDWEHPNPDFDCRQDYRNVRIIKWQPTDRFIKRCARRIRQWFPHWQT